MQFAVSADGSKISPSPEIADAKCPCCDSDVIPKCGKINIWHWAHKNNKDCDTWSEAEGPWHQSWKKEFPDSWHEIVMGENREHRADIRTPSELVIELQHSNINADEVKERECFYQHMIWFFDASEYSDRCNVAAWQNEYPHPRFKEGLCKQFFKLDDLDKVLIAKNNFYQGLENSNLEGLTDINDAPRLSREIREKSINKINREIKTAKEKITIYQQKLEEAPQHKRWQSLLKEWSNKYTNKLAELEDQKSVQWYLTKPYPAMAKYPEVVSLLSSSLQAWKIRFKWSNSRNGYLACQKPVFWDVASDTHLIYFPEGTTNRDCWNAFSGYVVNKDEVLECLRNT